MQNETNVHTTAIENLNNVLRITFLPNVGDSRSLKLEYNEDGEISVFGHYTTSKTVNAELSEIICEAKNDDLSVYVI